MSFFMSACRVTTPKEPKDLLESEELKPGGTDRVGFISRVCLARLTEQKSRMGVVQDGAQEMKRMVMRRDEGPTTFNKRPPSCHRHAARCTTSTNSCTHLGTSSAMWRGLHS